MKRIIQFTLIAVFAFAGMSSAIAQKLGHVDAQTIVYEMPEMKQAMSSLEALAGQYEKQLVSQKEQLEGRLVEAQKKQERGELSPSDIQRIQGELAAEEKKLIASEQEAKQNLLKKEEELTAPLYDKIKNAIKTVASENGYNNILDTSTLLYADENDNITSKVRSKLGM